MSPVQWQNERRSDNIEDRRGTRSVGGKSLGLGAVVLALAALYFGVDPRIVTALFDASGGGSGTPATTQEPVQESASEAELRDFVSAVLADTEDVWRDQFAQRKQVYREPKLVLFRGRVDSACGLTSSAVGPFYCPPDEKVYLDLAFMDDLRTKLGAPGDFAQAYVIAHEIGHHVQNLLGISEKVRAEEQRDPERANELSVRLELQADFLAGAWAHHADRMKHILEKGDLEEALNAASRIGDDVLQRRATGHVTPDAFTHGTAAQRVRWLRRGIDSGRIEDGDTFSAKEL
jgi:predicted metalloprotease